MGKCEGPDFKSAGPHFNPAGKKHGKDNPQGPHNGDLPNIEVGADGHATASMLDTNVTLGDGPTSLFQPGGTSIVIHASMDDYKTDPRETPAQESRAESFRNSCNVAALMSLCEKTASFVSRSFRYGINAENQSGFTVCGKTRLFRGSEL